MLRQTDYAKRREEIYSPIREEKIFTWDIDARDQEEFALATIYPVSELFVSSLRTATEKLGEIFAKTIRIVQKGSEELFQELGFPQETWATLRLSVADHTPTLLGRFDFAHTPNGLKMLEFNSDTPSKVVEAFYVNQKVCDYFGWQNPNHDQSRMLTDSFQYIRKRYQQLGYPSKHITFSSLDWHIEDSGTTRYLLQQSGLPATFVPLSKLVVQQDGLYVRGMDHPIDILFRFHALEILASEKSKSGFPVGAQLLQLIAQKKLAIINPPSGFISQNKAIQALIWNLHEQNMFFTTDEHEIIETYMLPSYLENVFTGKKPYVRKPIFGRNGGAITLYEKDGTITSQDDGQAYWDQAMMYQEKVPLEEIEVESMMGSYRGWLLWGCFLVDGKASAITTRISDRITGDSSRFLPIGLPL
ncbi:glutathionylspermidine synthase family protein [Shimazuella sp. KC615]|uniref:Glutathionylspermidine synthase family protein n=1 Tax=Shimazuella alba TaxID=2690964 RepID=A0A6I4VPS3_9BACL|nr:glutathionylspermidine synthase family protein [Shimazuella alba]